MVVHKNTLREETAAPRARGRGEVLGILAIALTLLLSLALASYDSRGGENLIGPLGEAIASVIVAAFGLAAWVIPFETGLAATRLFRGRSAVLGVATAVSTLVIVVVGCALMHLSFTEQDFFGGSSAGGALGEVLGEVLRSVMGTVGAYLLALTILLITFVIRAPLSLEKAATMLKLGAANLFNRLKQSVANMREAWAEARELERAERDEYEREFAPRIAGMGGDNDDLEASLDGIDADPALHESTTSKSSVDEPQDETPLQTRTKKSSKKKPSRKRGKKSSEDESGHDDLLAAVEMIEQEEADEFEMHPELDEPETPGPTRRSKKREKKDPGPTIVAPVQKTAKTKDEKPTKVQVSDKVFVLPPSNLLAEPPPNIVQVDADALRRNATRLVEKLEAYGVKGRVDEIHPGPVVTMYEFEPQSGTKLSKIANLADDLAMALAAQKVRIVAPIPGKARVGFELPNDNRQTVYLREIIEDDRWMKHKAALPIALGQDIAGNPVFGDLSKMPHLLVAGATGQGKSVGINVMLVSLLLRKSPEEVRLLMIDPKVVELQAFDGIPHMLLPVVTDMKKAALALRWAVDEMERRYQLFADAGSRNILAFNERVDKTTEGKLSVAQFYRRRKPDDDEPLVTPERLPHIVVVVDEFADLMMVAAKDVESCVARLAQKARAAGIHVVLATQRPSVDVITGMIKANFPARMAFKVSQREDSKTILGRNGAENLLGRGDLLMLPPGSSDLKRVHGAFIDEPEVREVCDFLREQGNPVYDDAILKPREDDDENGMGKTDDPLYDRAVQCVSEAGYCSISHVQRKLSVGYNKAAKLVDRMEAAGVVGPPSGKAGGRRQVLIQPH